MTPGQGAGRGLTRREFIPRIAAAALGAGALLRPAAGAPAAGAAGQMKYRALGRTGISVSEIGFGSHLSRQNMADPLARAAQIHKGLELGINLFDIYEHSYHQFGPMSELLRPRRRDVVISLVSVGSEDKAMDEVEHSLKTFGTDAIDLYRIYAAEGPAGTSRDAIDLRLGALQRAKEQGKVRAVGLAAHDQRIAVEVLRAHPELDYAMFPYNFRHRRLSPGGADEALSPPPAGTDSASGPADTGYRDCTVVPCPDPGFAALVAQRNLGLIAIKPFGGGGLLRLEPADPRLQPLADAGVSLPQAALAFILQAPQIASAIPAMNSIAEVVQNVGAVQGGGLSAPQGQYLEIYDEAAEQSGGAYLPEEYRWLEHWKA